MPDGAQQLYVRVRIDNARKQPTAVYWWSNIAVDEREDVRVIVPGEQGVQVWIRWQAEEDTGCLRWTVWI